jgi:arginase family enzyme
MIEGTSNKIKVSYEDVVLNQSDVLECHKRIEEKISKTGPKAIILGGDHSITYSCVKGFAKHKKDFCLVVFDAHPDLIKDFSPPTHESYLRALIEGKVVKSKDVLLVGVRNSDKLENNYISKKKINCIYAKEFLEKGIKAISDKIEGFCKERKKPVYFSIDVDAIDPIEAMGTGYIEFGGLLSRELFFVINNIKNTNLIEMCDIVEINPNKDFKDITCILGAKLALNLIDI